MPHEEYIERVFSELQGDLSADDARVLESHLANCPDCLREAKSLRDAAASLAYVAAPVEPPKEIRDRLLQRVAALESEASTSSSDQQPSNVAPLAGRSKSNQSAYFSRSAVFSAAVAASLVIAALIIALIYLWSRNQSLRAELSQTYGRLSQVEGELEQVRDERFILTAAASRIRPLEGTPVAPRANALLSYDRDTGRALLYVNNLPQAPAGKAYQLWAIAGGKPFSAAVFNVDASGRATLRPEVPREGLNATLFAVTLEPEAGVPSPTGDKYLLSAAS